MGLKISFELDDEDLEHFRLVMLHARDAVARRSPEEIVAAAKLAAEGAVAADPSRAVVAEPRSKRSRRSG